MRCMWGANTKKASLSHKHALILGFAAHAYSFERLELELELVLSQTAQKPVLRGYVGVRMLRA